MIARRDPVSMSPAGNLLSDITLMLCLSSDTGRENAVPQLQWGAAVGEISLVADAKSNVILIHGPKASRVRVISLAAELDRRPKQVYIKAVIARVRIDGEIKSSMQVVLGGVIEKSKDGSRKELLLFLQPIIIP